MRRIGLALACLSCATTVVLTRHSFDALWGELDRWSYYQRLSDEFKILIKPAGTTPSPSTIVQRGPFEVEEDHLTLPRLSFPHTRYKFGMIRRLIDRINECDPA